MLLISGREVLPTPPQLFGLYFSALGRVSDQPNIDVVPVGDHSEVQVKLPQAEGAIEDLLTKNRYAILTAIKVDRENFPLFAGRIGEIDDVGGRQMHRLHIRNQYDEVRGYMSQINVRGLTREQLEGLGDDLQLLIVDRENPGDEVEFRAYSEVIKGLEDDFEGRKELSREIPLK